MSDTVNARSDGNKFSYWSRYLNALGELVLAVLLLLPLLACAQTEPGANPANLFRIEKGEQYAVCRTMRDNLNAFADHPLTADWPISPRFPLLRAPVWQRIDLQAHMPIVRHMFVYRSDSYRRRATTEADRQFADKAQVDDERNMASILSEPGVALERAHFDFDNDGQSDEVYRLGGNSGLGWKYSVAYPPDSMPERDFVFSGRDFMFDGRTFLTSTGIPRSLLTNMPLDSTYEQMIVSEIITSRIGEKTVSLLEVCQLRRE